MKKELLFALPVAGMISAPEVEIRLAPYKVRVVFDNKKVSNADADVVADRFAALLNRKSDPGEATAGTVELVFTLSGHSSASLQDMTVEIPAGEKIHLYKFPQPWNDLIGKFPLAYGKECSGQDCLQIEFNNAFQILEQDWAALFVAAGTRFSGESGLRYVRTIEAEEKNRRA